MTDDVLLLSNRHSKSLCGTATIMIMIMMMIIIIIIPIKK